MLKRTGRYGKERQNFAQASRAGHATSLLLLWVEPLSVEPLSGPQCIPFASHRYSLMGKKDRWMDGRNGRTRSRTDHGRGRRQTHEEWRAADIDRRDRSSLLKSCRWRHPTRRRGIRKVQQSQPASRSHFALSRSFARSCTEEFHSISKKCRAAAAAAASSASSSASLPPFGNRRQKRHIPCTPPRRPRRRHNSQGHRRKNASYAPSLLPSFLSSSLSLPASAFKLRDFSALSESGVIH